MPTTTQPERKHYREMTPREMTSVVKSIIREVERKYGQDTQALNQRLEEEIGLSTGIDIIWGAMGCHQWMCSGPNNGVIPRATTPSEQRPRVVEVYDDLYHLECETLDRSLSHEMKEKMRKAAHELRTALRRASRNGEIEGNVIRESGDCRNKYQRAPESVKKEHKEVVKLLLDYHDGSYHGETGKVTELPW